MLKSIFKALNIKASELSKNSPKDSQVDDDYTRTIMGASDMGTCGYNEQAYFDRQKSQATPQQKQEVKSKISEEETYDLTVKTLNPFS